MPYKLKTRCRYPGCPELVRGYPYCVSHRREIYRLRDERRGTAAARGYDEAWSRVAAQRRQLDCYLCQPCLLEDRLAPAKTVDHIIPVHVRPDWRLELRNTQVICVPCHQRKTAEDSRRYGSSTTDQLSETQRQERQLAQDLRDPPRSADDG